MTHRRSWTAGSVVGFAGLLAEPVVIGLPLEEAEVCGAIASAPITSEFTAHRDAIPGVGTQ